MALVYLFVMFLFILTIWRWHVWGRKDPMLPGNGVGDADKTCFTTDAQYRFAYKDHGEPLNTNDIKEYIKNPHKFNIKLEMDGQYYNLWSTDNESTDANDDLVIKSVYDPSHVGYSLPASNAFTGFTTTGGYTDNPSDWNVKGNFDKGWHFYTKPYKQGSTIFFPACGGRSPDKGILYLVSLHSICQLAGPGTDIQGLHFYFFSYSIGTIYSNSRSYGFAVRSAEEKKMFYVLCN